MSPQIHSLLDDMKIDAGIPESARNVDFVAHFKDADIQAAAVDPLPLSEGPWMHSESENDSSHSEEDSVDGDSEEMEIFSPILAPTPKYKSDAEDPILRRTRYLVQEVSSLGRLWRLENYRSLTFLLLTRPGI